MDPQPIYRASAGDIPPSELLESPPVLTQYTKAIVSIIAAALVVIGAALTDDVVSQVEAINIGIAIVTAVGVYLVPNLDEGLRAHAKGLLAFVGAALAALLTVLADNVTASEWITVTLAGLGAIGVVVLPNTQPSDYVPRHRA